MVDFHWVSHIAGEKLWLSWSSAGFAECLTLRVRSCDCHEVVLVFPQRVYCMLWSSGGFPGAQQVNNLTTMRRPGFNPWVGKTPWRREQLPTPVFWPGESHRLYSPWGRQESDMTERLSLDFTDHQSGRLGTDDSRVWRGWRLSSTLCRRHSAPVSPHPRELACRRTTWEPMGLCTHSLFLARAYFAPFPGQFEN